jgi:hypothetical protein
MAFIDIFNFKKYFSKPSDAQVARYGHVNALYDQLSANTYTSPYKSYVAQFSFDANQDEGLQLIVEEIYNDLDVTITWAVPSPGDSSFTITSSSSIFIQEKLYFAANCPNDDATVEYNAIFTRSSGTELIFSVRDSGAFVSYIGTTTDPAKIEIRVYN